MLLVALAPMRLTACTTLALFAFIGWMPDANATPAPEPDQCHLGTAPPTSAQWSSRIPANAPAFVLQQASVYGLSFSVEGSSLRSKGNPDVPLELVPDDRLEGAVLLVPKASLAARTDYELSLDISCPSADPGFVTTKAASRFRAWDESALPTTSGTATAELPGDPNSFSSIASLIHITPSPELRAYLATTMFELAVDGKKFAIVSYGERYWSGASVDATIDIAVSTRADAWSQRTNVSACAAGEDGIVTKTVTVQPHVAGAERDPDPVSVQVPLDCRPLEAYVEPPASSSDGAGASAARGDGDAGGCGVSGARAHLASQAVLGCLAAVFAVLTLRRRRPHGGSRRLRISD